MPDNDFSKNKSSLNVKKTKELASSSSNKALSYEELLILEQKVKTLQNNRKILLKQKLDCEKSFEELKKEIKKLKQPPLITGYIEDILTDATIIVRVSTGSSFIVGYSNDLCLKDLKIGAKVSLNQKYLTIVQVLPLSTDVFIRSMVLNNRPVVKYTDIGGLDQQIEQIKNFIQLPLEKPELFKKIGIEPPKGVLLYGTSGAGKTLLAKAVASEMACTFINIVGSALVQTYIGEGTRIIRELFAYAKKHAPTIIFIDELDAIGFKREINIAGDFEVHRTLMELLAQLDGFYKYDQVKIIAATNRIDILDPALIRRGRFDKLIFVPFPDTEGRKSIFQIYLRHMNISFMNEDFNTIITLTENFTGAEIKSLCTEAGINAIRKSREIVLKEDFLIAIHKMNLSRKSQSSVESISYV